MNQALYVYQSYPNYVFQLQTCNLKYQNTAEYILPYKQYAKTSNKPKKDIRHTHIPHMYNIFQC